MNLRSSSFSITYISPPSISSIHPQHYVDTISTSAVYVKSWLQRFHGHNTGLYYLIPPILNGVDCCIWLPNNLDLRLLSFFPSRRKGNSKRKRTTEWKVKHGAHHQVDVTVQFSLKYTSTSQPLNTFSFLPFLATYHRHHNIIISTLPLHLLNYRRCYHTILQFLRWINGYSTLLIVEFFLLFD